MKELNKKNFFLYISLVIIILLSGCGPRLARPLRGYETLKSQSFPINGQHYVSLDNFLGAYLLDCEWSSVSQHLFLANPQLSISLRCESSIALINGETEHLSSPVLMRESKVVIPLEMAKAIDAIYTRAPEVGLFRLKTVIIDPGHGGKDPGAVGRSGLREKDVVLDISLKLKKLLEAEGIKVIMTRSSDRFVSLWKRTSVANSCQADFFISIHANAARSRYARGFEVYYLSDAIDKEARAVAAAENAVLQFEESSIDRHTTDLDATLWDLCFAENQSASSQMAKILCDTAARELKSKNRGVKTARFYVLKGVRIPAVLIEVGFISNKYEEENLKSSYYRKQLASALAEGILSYKREFEKTNGFTN